MNVCCCSLPPSCCKNCSNNVNYDFDHGLMFSSQERLGGQFEKILYDNLQELLIKTDFDVTVEDK